MDDHLAQFLHFTESNRDPNAPRLSLEIEESDTVLSVEEQNGLIITIKRDNDSHDQSCTFAWNGEVTPFSISGFILFHHSSNRLEKLTPSPNDPLSDSIAITPENRASYWQLGPGQQLRQNIPLPWSVWEQLVPGDQYELFWPGLELPLWRWGTVTDHNDSMLRWDSQRPRLVIPGGARCSISVIKEARLFPPLPLPPPVSPSNRVPGAPILSLTLECPATVSAKSPFKIVKRLAYDTPSETDSTILKPITLHTIELLWSGNFVLHRRSKEDKVIWEASDLDISTGIGATLFVDDPDVDINVSQHKDFTSISPGAAWTVTEGIQFDKLPADTQVGDVYRYQYRGGTVDWWDWGDQHEHADTVVSLPCWIKGKVTSPGDNDGRPRLVVPASNSVEFTIVD